jgi:putative ABC transport system permease protein
MPTGKLVRLLGQNLRRNVKHLLLSAFGIVVGIAAFVFFWGLSRGVSHVLLHDIFPIDRIEVVAPKTSITGVQIKLDDKVVESVRARPEVKRAFPKMKLSFPAMGTGTLKLGQEKPYPMKFEVAGFCDGVDASLVQGDPGTDLFRDWDVEDEGKLEECGPAPTNGCPKDRFCDLDDRKCHHRVPVLVSRTLIEIYNSSFAPAHGMPRVGAAQEALISGRLKSMKFNIHLGESIVEGIGEVKAPPKLVEAQVVGISDKAMPIGMTIPLGYVRRWNERWGGPQTAAVYSSIVVDLKDKEHLASFVPWVRTAGYEQEESQAERIAAVITVVTTLFLVIAFIICFISALNIAHTFFMLISERRKELGLMRALGASRWDIWKIILGEAAAIGLVGGGLGIALALGLAKLIDLASARWLPDYPFKPETYFTFSPLLIGAALAFAVAFCLLGASLPARKAARIHPAQALTG